MPITHITAHHITKQNDEEAILSLRDSELANNPQQTMLFESLKKSFSTRISRRHGSFDDSIETATLPQNIESFLKDKTQFQSISHQFTNKLAEQLNQQKGDINAHCIFVAEENEKQSLFYLFIVHQNEYLTFDDTLDIGPSYSIDTGSSLCGIKLNINDWQERPKYHYLTFVPPKGNEVLSTVLQDLTGFGNKIDRTKSTKEFLEKIDVFSEQMPKETQNEFKEKVIEYCEEQESKDEAVHIQALSQSIEGIDCEKFIRQMLPHNPTQQSAEEDPEDDAGLMIDKRSLRQYVKFYGRDKDISLTFSSKQLDESIFYDEASDTLTIQNIPKSLKKQLIAHHKRNA